MSSPASPADRIPWARRLRALVGSVGTTAYVVATAVWKDEAAGLRVFLLSSIALFVAWRATKRASMAGAIATWGIAISIASIASREGSRWLDAAGIAGALAAAGAARWSIAHVITVPSLGTARLRAPRNGIALLGAVGAIALYVVLRARPGVTTFALAPYARAFAAAAPSIAGVMLLGAGFFEMRRRALEMGVVARLAAAMGLLATVAILSTGFALLGTESPDRIARVALAIGALLVVWVARHGDGVRIAHIARRALVLSFVGGTVALVGAGAIVGRGRDGALVVMATALVTLAIGAAAPFLEDPLRPVRGAWIDAVEKAREILLQEDSEEAIRRMLVAVRDPAGGLVQTPELWTLAPTRVATIDAAGYLHERDGELPGDVLAHAAKEPEATLRMEVVDALQVRRPELRPLVKWMEARDALSATIVTRGGEPEGLLVLTRGPRYENLTLEEARGIKRLADALAFLCDARSSHLRSLAREQALTHRAEAAEEKLDVLDHRLALHANRHALAATRLARPATVGIYSAASRLALEAIERRAFAGAPVLVISPSGVDPVPYLARAHLAGPRREGPLVVVDGTQAREHDVARWTDRAASPLALADRGTLLLVDAAALPADVQRTIARALLEKRPPWEQSEPLDVILHATLAAVPGRAGIDDARHPADVKALVESGRLDPTLAARLADACEAPIVLPRLRDRPEDLRAIVTDRLAREGLRVRGAPVGIEPAAFARLVEHPFPGEESELAAIVQRLVASCSGDLVRAADVDALGLAPQPPPASEAAPQRASEPPGRRRKRKDPVSA